MNVSDFYNYYIKNFENVYSERFKKINISKSPLISYSINSILERDDSQCGILEEFRKLVRRTGGKDTWIIYVIIENETGKVRVGKTQQSINDRWKAYKKTAKAKKGDVPKYNFPFFEAIRKHNYRRNDFKILIIDVQDGDLESRISEEFFTIYFNRDSADRKGYNLEKNWRYNMVVGDISDAWEFENEFNPIFKKIDYRVLVRLIKKGFERADVSLMLGVSRWAIDNRIRAWFHSNTTFKKVQYDFIGEEFIKLFKKGLNSKEICIKFVKIDFPNKEEQWANIPENEININELKLVHYKKQWVNSMCHRLWGIDWVSAYEKFYVKPLVIACMRAGLIRSKAAEILNELGCKNYRKIAVGSPWASQSLGKLINRLWRTTYNTVKEDLLEPIIANFLKNDIPVDKIGIKLSEIALKDLIFAIKRTGKSTNSFKNKLKVSTSAILNYINKKWSVNAQKARFLIKAGRLYMKPNRIISVYQNSDYLEDY